MAAAVVMSAIAVLAPPVPVASAHATLFTTPTADGAVPVSPKALELVFDQAVVSSASSLKLSDTEGETWPIEHVESGRNGRTVTARVPTRLPFGQYLVRWQVTADDGDSMIGQYTSRSGRWRRHGVQARRAMVTSQSGSPAARCRFNRSVCLSVRCSIPVIRVRRIR